MRLKRLHEPERSHFARIPLRNRIFSKGGAEPIGAALRIACPPMLSLLSFERTVCHDDRRCPAHRHTRLTHNALCIHTMNRIPITAAGAAKLKAELDYLKKTARPNVVAAIAEAREKGDLSENAEYDAAREEQGHIEGRIAELEGKIPALQVIDPKTVAAGDRIVFGATVTLYDEEEDPNVTYQIVGDDEADIKKNLISVSSPIARALIGKSEGDTVVFMAPKGKVTFEVETVEYK